MEIDQPEQQQQQRKSAAEIEREQEALFKAKFGGGGPGGLHAMKRKQPLIAKDHGKQFFDSADWSLAKSKAKAAAAGGSGERGSGGAAPAEEPLPPCIGPTTIAAVRRRSDCATATGLSRHDD